MMCRFSGNYLDVARDDARQSRLNGRRLAVVGLAAAGLVFVFTLLAQFTSVLLPPIRSALPTYSVATRTRAAVGVTQVAVLFFAGLVAILQFVANSSRFGFDSNRLLVFAAVLSVICVLSSGGAAVFSVLLFLPSVLFAASLFLPGAGFVLSVVVALIIVVNLVVPPQSDDEAADDESTDDWDSVWTHGHPSSVRFRP